jgi:glycosyltransferase involved in cell wall biosynthesis
MNILMLTNTYLPHVGGVARSVESFRRELAAMGHRVLVVAPEFEGMPDDEEGVIRIPAVQNFNGSDFSVSLPIPGLLTSRLEDLQPDIVHSHHPFLLGGTAVRVAARHNIPLLFTHHTLYEQYTHYVPGDSPGMKRFTIHLTTGYCNLCSRVIAPSESVKALLEEREVTRPISVVPTGVDVEKFNQGDGAALRRKMGIPADAFVVGHLGRLAPEKNLGFLAESVERFLKLRSDAHFLVVGEGRSKQSIQERFERTGLDGRLHFAGTLEKQALIDAYHAMDVFAFASMSETQGMVVTEAMAASLPVAALDASGVREVVRDGENGRLLESEDADAFCEAIGWLAERGDEEIERLRTEARRTAEAFSMRNCALRIEEIYHKTCLDEMVWRPAEVEFWEGTLEMLRSEWDLLSSVAEAAVSTIMEEAPESEEATPAEGEKAND